MEDFLRKNAFTNNRDILLTPPTENEIIKLDETYFAALHYENYQRFKSSFTHFDAPDLAEIEFFHSILQTMGKVLVITSSDGLKEYIEWYSKRSHIKKDKQIYFVGGPMETENEVIIADFSQMQLVEQILQQLFPYDILVQDLDKATPRLLKTGGVGVFKLTKYSIDKIQKLASNFSEVKIINSSVNTAHIYMICFNKKEEKKQLNILYDVNKAFIDAYIASKTCLINTRHIAFTFDNDKIMELWTLPKPLNIAFSRDPAYLVSKFISLASKVKFDLHKPPKPKKIVERVYQKPEYKNGLIIFAGVGEIQEDKLFEMDFTAKEKRQMKSFTKSECIEIMLKSDVFIDRIYSKLFSSSSSAK